LHIRQIAVFETLDVFLTTLALRSLFDNDEKRRENVTRRFVMPVYPEVRCP
jgi:hypothetical protein